MPLVLLKNYYHGRCLPINNHNINSCYDGPRLKSMWGLFYAYEKTAARLIETASATREWSAYFIPVNQGAESHL